MDLLSLRRLRLTSKGNKMGWLDRERTIAPPGFNRWLVPPAALAVHLCIGQAYATSVYKTALVKHFGASLTEIGVIFSIAIVMLGTLRGHHGDLGGYQRAPQGHVHLGSVLGQRLPDRLARHLHAPAVARLSRLRRRRRHRPGHRLHLARVHPDQMVPGPAGPRHRHGHHGLRRGSPDRQPGLHGPAQDVRPQLRRPGLGGQRRRGGQAVPDPRRRLFGLHAVRRPHHQGPGRGLETGRLRPGPGQGRQAGDHGERFRQERREDQAVLARLDRAVLQRHGRDRHSGAGRPHDPGLLPPARRRFAGQRHRRAQASSDFSPSATWQAASPGPPPRT